MDIRSVAVIGSGVMGSAIAAHIANAGLPVRLLDIAPKSGRRDGLARAALERLRKADPPPFMSAEAAARVTPGCLDDDLDRLGEADWIVEAIVENSAIKQDLYRKLERARRPGSLVTSNTSTLPLARLVDGMPQSFRRDFLIAHFFNPPRFMRLLELVPGPDTRPEALATVREVADRRLGKGVVVGKDTAGFVGNRIGIFWIQAALNAAIDLGLSVEEADAIAGRPMGVPKTGVFGLLDLVGLDLMPHVVAGLLDGLPTDDPYRALFRDEPLIHRLIADGYTGRKGKGGFYRLAKDADGKRAKEAVDLASGRFRPARKPRLAAVDAAKGGDLRALIGHDSPGGRFAWQVLVETLAYAAGRVPEICDDILGVDRAMRLGYNWRWGPFELIDRIGAGWLAAELAAKGHAVPPLLARAAEAGGFYRVRDGQLQHLTLEGRYAPVTRPDGVLLLEDVKRRSEPLLRNRSAALWDLGDGVTCFEFTSKMNALDDQTLALLGAATALTADRFTAMVIYNEGENFSVGANLGLALFAINVALWDQIETLIETGQQTFKGLKYASFPVVAAPSGLALGGGCEILLHADAIQAHAETYTGLVEAAVGIVPAWGGTKELLLRHRTRPGAAKGPMPAVMAAFQAIGTAQVAKSAEEARAAGILRADDRITMNRDRLLADAKARALELARDYRPPAPPDRIALPGRSGRVALDLAVRGFALAGKATPHDAMVAKALARLLTGGEAGHQAVDEDGLLALEREAFMALIRTPGTLARMEHMLETGKPLRN